MKRIILIFNLIISGFLIVSCTDTSKKASLIEMKEFKGLIISDEENALKSGETVLNKGGNAIDSAVSVALTLPLTLPSRASLSSVGECKVYNPLKYTVKTYEFKKPNLLLKTLILMHSDYGSLRFSSLASEPEIKANLGFVPDNLLISDIMVNNAPDYYKNVKKGLIYKNLPFADLMLEIRTSPYKGYYNDKIYQGLDLNGDDFYTLLPKISNKDIINDKFNLPSATTEFVVMDKAGYSVVCSLSLGEFFGKKKVFEGISMPLNHELFSPKLDINLKNGYLKSISTSKDDKISCDKDNFCDFNMKTNAYNLRVFK